jgi:hypothetical protein
LEQPGDEQPKNFFNASDERFWSNACSGFQEVAALLQAALDQ